jgi:hypothetical protein
MLKTTLTGGEGRAGGFAELQVTPSCSTLASEWGEFNAEKVVRIQGDLPVWACIHALVNHARILGLELDPDLDLILDPAHGDTDEIPDSFLEYVFHVLDSALCFGRGG